MDDAETFVGDYDQEYPEDLRLEGEAALRGEQPEENSSRQVFLRGERQCTWRQVAEWRRARASKLWKLWRNASALRVRRAGRARRTRRVASRPAKPSSGANGPPATPEPNGVEGAAPTAGAAP